MASVFIDIPGVGTVEAKNAATEATLQAILKAIKAGGGVGSGSPASPKDAKEANKSLTGLEKQSKSLTKGFIKLTDSLTGTIRKFANVGDSLTSAASIFDKVPILGTVFSAVAEAVEKTTGAYKAAAASGATFGGSVNNFAKAAGQAGMTMDRFGQLIAKNGSGLLGFGSTTEEGAKRFSQVSKALRATGSDLYALGYGTEEINQGLASYGDLLRKQGLQGTKSNTELAAGAQKYMKELDALAKISGEERSVKEAQMKQLATDAQFQMAMAGKSEETRASFMKLVGGFGPTLGGFVKDFVATGTSTTEANQKIASALGGATMDELTKLRQKLMNNQELTDEEQDRLRAIMKKASEAESKRLGGALAANRDNDAMAQAYIEGMQLQTGAVKKTTEEQNKAAKSTDGQVKATEEAKAKLAEFSNSFQMALANSGILNTMMSAFTILANIVQNFLVPVFNMLTTGIQAAFEFLYPAFLTIAGFLVADILPIFQSLGSVISEYVWPALQLISGIVVDYVLKPFMSVAGFIWDNLVPVLAALGTMFLAMNARMLITEGLEMAKSGLLMIQNGLMFIANGGLLALAGSVLAAAAPFLAIAIPVFALVAIFKALYDSGWSLGTAWDAVKDNLERFGMHIMEFIDKIRTMLPERLGGLSDDEKKARDDARNARRNQLNDAEKSRDAERAKLAKERSSETKQEKRDQAAASIDQRILGLKQGHAGKLDAANKAEIAAKEEKAALDYGTSDATALLGAELKAQKSGILPASTDGTKAVVAKAEEAKKAAEDAKTAADKKAEDAKKIEEEKKGTKPVPAQESAESLLSSLNTKLEQLLAVNKGQLELESRQLSAVQAMSNDLLKAV
jgi:Mg2+ and Co2+ transporter CorA